MKYIKFRKEDSGSPLSGRLIDLYYSSYPHPLWIDCRVKEGIPMMRFDRSKAPTIKFELKEVI